MQWLASLCIRQPVFTWVLMLVFVVIGTFGYFSLGVDQFPKIDFPAIVVTTTENGAAPEEIETELTDKIEGGRQHHQRHRRAPLHVEPGRLARHHQLQPRQGRRRRGAGGARPHQQRPARSPQGDRSAGRVQDRPRRVAHPLRHAEHPRVASATSPSSPTSACAARSRASTASGRSASSAARSGRSTSGSTRSSSRPPGSPRSTWSARSPQQNLSVPGGQIETGPKSLTLRVEGRVDDVGQDRPHRHPGEPGPPDAHRRRRAGRRRRGGAKTSASEDGRESVVLSVRKQSGENTVAVVDAVKARLGEVEKSLPAGLGARGRARRVGLDPHQRRRRQGAPRPRRVLRGRHRAHLPRQLRGARSSPPWPSRSRSSAPSRSCGRWASRSTSSRCSPWRWPSASSSTTRSSCSRTSSASSRRRSRSPSWRPRWRRATSASRCSRRRSRSWPSSCRSPS